MRPAYERLFLLVAVAYVAITGWAMSSLSYDVWGGFVLVPLLVLVTVALLRRVFRGELTVLFPIAIAGLVAKLSAAVVRYWVAFDAYGGVADAGSYHEAGKRLAGEIRNGGASLMTLVTGGTGGSSGTRFVERVTAAVYSVFGSSRMGGFFIFAWFAYIGTVLYVLTAVRAVPALPVRRYAWLLFLAPSLLFWPSSIGKESLLMLFLGCVSYAGVRLMHRRWGGWTLPLLAFGTAGSVAVRPHVTAIWSAGLVVGVVATLAMGRRLQAKGSSLGTAVMVVLAAVIFVFVASSALRFLDPGSDSVDAKPLSDRVDAIFNSTTERTAAGGSMFEGVTIRGPVDWPYAIVRTLTRPLITEVDTLTEFLPSVETTALVVLAIVGWKRLANIPRLMRSTPYLWMALSVLVMFGLAFSVFRNLGLLARQRALVVPFMVLLVCLPPFAPRPSARPPIPVSRRRSPQAPPVPVETRVGVSPPS